MIYLTGDTHGDWRRFSTSNFPDQKEMTRDDVVIVCGDFGIWHDTKEERYWLNWLAEKPFTVCFIDGNHENFDRLYGGEFPEIDYCGGKAHKIRENIYHLERGYVFEICGKKIFAFGGASSHDIDDGILDRDDYVNDDDFYDACYRYRKYGKSFRINHLSWWKEELPSQEEMDRGINSLNRVGWKVDYIVTHCAPQQIASIISNGFYGSDKLTMYFNGLLDKGIQFDSWFFGHYHNSRRIMSKFYLLYGEIMRIE